MDWLQKERARISASIKTKFVTGLVIFLPVALSLYILYRIFDFLDSFLDPFIVSITGYSIPGMGVLLLILLIFGVGTVATNVIGHRLVIFLENVMSRIPIFKKFYTTLKTVMESFSPNGQKGFRKVVLAEYPREGVWTLGFFTGSVRFGKDGPALQSVFFPSNNIYIGIQAFLPEEKILETTFSVEEGMKLILSGGITLPEHITLFPLGHPPAADSPGTSFATLK
jgi:uncharacterized membrane protein